MAYTLLSLSLSLYLSLSLLNAVCFIILTYLVPVLFTFYIWRVLKLKKIIPAPKGLTMTRQNRVRKLTGNSALGCGHGRDYP